jgi:crossover junction endodeoxyribonuclease RuvC
VRVFGIDPGSERTGYGCVETDGRRHRLMTCGAISAPAADAFPDRLARIHRELAALLSTCRPDCVAIESVFHANNVRSALKLGHARGVAMLAAVEAGCPIVEYTATAVKRAIVGYGRAEKHQVQQMIKLLLGLDTAPSPHDAADALAVAICHLHSMPPVPLQPSRAKRASASLAEASGAGGKPDTTCEVGIRKQRASAEPPTPNPVSRMPRTWRQYRPPSNG